jgi:hypothetical protein
MYAVVVKVTVADKEAAVARLQNEVVPQVSAAPGFVAGHWIHLPQGQGIAVMAFESEDAAQAAAGKFPRPGCDAPVTFDDVEVGEVVAHA